MKTPYYETTAIIGGTSQTEKVSALPTTINVRQSGRLRIICTDENSNEFDISDLSNTDAKAKPYGTNEAEVTLGTGSVKYTPEIFTITANSSPSTGGTFTLTVAGEETSAIAYNATASTIQTELEALASRSAGDFEVIQTSGLNLGEASASVRVSLSGGFALTARSSIDTGSLTGGQPHSLTTVRTQSTLQNMYEVSWVKDKIPAGWATYPEALGTNSGTLVIWVELEETGTGDYYQLSQRVNIEAGDFSQAGDVTPDLGVIYYYNSVYEYDNTLTDADPGAGKFRMDAIALASVTEAYFADDNKQGVNQSSILQSLPIGTKLVLGNPNVRLESALFTVSGAATNNSGYTTLPITYVDSGTSQLTNSSNFSFNIDVNISESFGISYEYDSTTADADPGAGKFRYNNASPASATIIYIADDDKSGVDNSAYLQSLKVGDFLKISDITSPTAANSFSVSGAITNATGYSKVPVTHIDAGAGSLTNGNEMSFYIDVLELQLGSTAGTACEGNDSRIPTQDENDILGTITPFIETLLDDADATTARTTIGLGNVDNTSDAAKPVSTAQQTALDLKLNANDTKIPTQDENDALAGTDGTPDSSNKFVTNSDPRNSDSRAPSGSAGGDLTGTYPNPTIAAEAVTNAKQAQMATLTLKGNKTGGSATPTDLTISEVHQILGIEYKDFYIDAAAFKSSTTNGATAGSIEYATNDIDIDFYDFDPDTDESIQLKFKMPEDWDLGTIKIKAYWTDGDTAGTGNVIWSFAAGAVSNDDAIDSALGTAQSVTDAFIATGDSHETDPTSSLTVGGTPALGDLIFLKVSRDADNGSDTYTQKARLIGVAVQYKKKTSAVAEWS